jgi:NAD(P)-dependent dehydrogenase (short-subunit alcohol dehydrogenase family)
MAATWSQFYPPAPTLTEKTLPSQKGKVFMVTGASLGVGLELTKMLYEVGAKVYMATRSEGKTKAAMQSIQSQSLCATPGELVYLHLELDDLASVKKAAEEFLSKEPRLDVLWNNAGVHQPPKGSKSKQGYELQIATNCLGPHLLTKLLLPALEAAASNRAPGSVRIVWVSSIMMDLTAPKGGFTMAQVHSPPSDPMATYVLSKTGNLFLGSEVARRSATAAGILSVTLNPGNLKSDLLRTAPRLMAWLSAPMLHHPRMGAYTELWAGLSEQLGMTDAGAYIIPWGRKHPSLRKDLIDAMKEVKEGGSGHGSGIL